MFVDSMFIAIPNFGINNNKAALTQYKTKYKI